MPLAEGSNIHFSPVDNKPLCSYSNKLCRQRRLNGYGFCIRHILEDKSAPFKQCEFVTRNNSQKCLNAIPTSQERGYCQGGGVSDLCKSHMQVAGIIPKTVKKVKSPASTTLCSKPSTGDKSGVGLPLPSNSDSNGLKTPKPSPLINGIKPPPPSTKSTPTPKSEKGKTNASTNSTSSATNAGTSINHSNGPGNQLGPNAFLPPPPDLIPKKKSKGKKGNAEGQVPKPPPKSKKKKVGVIQQSLCPPKWKSVPETPLPTSTAFEQLKTLKILEKLTLRTGGETKGSVLSNDPPEISLVPPFLRKSTEVNPRSTLDENENNSNPNPSGSRQEFLKRVRSSFQSQYKLLRNVVKVNEKSEVRVNEALRGSLLSCVLIDPSRCAHILVNGEDELEVDSKGKKVTTAVKPTNGVLNGKRKDVGSSLQGTPSNFTNDSTLLNPEKKRTTKPKKGKGKKVKQEEVTSDDGSMLQFQHSLNHVQIKVENGHVTNQFLDPWINGNFKILETIKPSGQKTKSKAKPVVKIEADCIMEEKKVPVQRKQQRNGSWKQENGNGHVNNILPPPIKNSKKEVQGRRHGVVNMENGRGSGAADHQQDHFNNNHANVSSAHLGEMPLLLDSSYSDHSFAAKKRRIEMSESASTIMSTNGIHNHSHRHHHHHILDPNITLNATAAFHYSPSDLSAVAQFENALNSVSSSDTATTPDGVITDASFDSPFDHSTSSHPDCDFPDDVDDLEKSFELHIDPEIAHQASRLIEENGFTEDDFSELFPDNRFSDHGKLGSELGLDFTSSNFEPTDIDYAIFSNIFPSSTNYHRPSGGSSESVISVTQNF